MPRFPRKFGRPLADVRREWRAAGLCRDCGAEADGKRRCTECARRVNRAKRLKREAAAAAGLAKVVRNPPDKPLAPDPASLKPVLVQLPRAVFEAAKADAAERGESLEEWIGGRGGRNLRRRMSTRKNAARKKGTQAGYNRRNRKWRRQLLKQRLGPPPSAGPKQFVFLLPAALLDRLHEAAAGGGVALPQFVADAVAAAVGGLAVGARGRSLAAREIAARPRVAAPRRVRCGARSGGGSRRDNSGMDCGRARGGFRRRGRAVNPAFVFSLPPALIRRARADARPRGLSLEEWIAAAFEAAIEARTDAAEPARKPPGWQHADVYALPAELVARAERAAAAQGVSLAEWTLAAVEAAVGQPVE